MAIIPNGKVIQGEEARAKVTEQILKKANLQVRELEFILAKLKDASYKGHEFETFYAVWVKLTTMLENSKNNSEGL
jgi:hypothetical protein